MAISLAYMVWFVKSFTGALLHKARLSQQENAHQKIEKFDVSSVAYVYEFIGASFSLKYVVAVSFAD